MKKTALIVFVLVLVGCSKQEEYTVDYLYKHDDIRQKVINDCKVNKQTDSNCKNASEAEAKKFNSSENKKRSKTKVVFDEKGNRI